MHADKNFTIRALSRDDSDAIEHVRLFFQSHLDGQETAKLNTAGAGAMNMPEHYLHDGSRLFYAEFNGEPAGCAAVSAFSSGVCELKRLYVEPIFRGCSLGRALALVAINAARELGYQRVLIDSLPNAQMAVKLYRELGFVDAPAYYPGAIEGTSFLSLDLESWSEKATVDENLFHLFDYNRAWARQTRALDENYFNKLAAIQAPQYLWIGCSDSRVPANQIVGLMPGEVFVQRNIANIVAHTDLNCLSVIQYAVDVLQVRHIMVVGHYGCGGILATLQGKRVGMVDVWLRHVRDVYQKHRRLIDSQGSDEQKHQRLCEVNVLEQVRNVCQTTVVQDAWQRGQAVTVHGWLYGIGDGLMHDLGITIDEADELDARYRVALAALKK